MVTNKKVLAVLVLDESGSMIDIKDKTISCVNEYVETLEPQGKSCHMTLVTFNSNGVKTVCNDVPVKDVPKLNESNYVPQDATPLLDAVGKTITNIESTIGEAIDRPDILFLVMTDGLENNSHQYNYREIINMISEREKAGGWTFVYLGANQDSWASAASLGYANIGNVSNFASTARGMSMAMANTISARNLYFEKRDAHYSSQQAAGANIAEINFMDSVFFGNIPSKPTPRSTRRTTSGKTTRRKPDHKFRG